MTKQKRAQRIVELVGGESNIRSITHCVTRLRFTLVNNGQADLHEIKNLEGILGAQTQGEQTQVIIGGEVGKIFREILKQYPNLSSIEEKQKKKKKQTIFNKLVDTLSAILVPSLAPIVGGGMLKGVLFLLTNENVGILEMAGGTAQILTIASDCMFYFFPFLLALSAAKKFKTNEYMALSLAGALMYPTLIAAVTATGEPVANIMFLGFIPIMVKNYSASVIPIILAVWILSYVYRFFEDKMPSMITVIFTPLLTLIIMVPLMLFCIAPIGFYLGEYIAIGLDQLIGFAPWLAGFIIGATRPFLVLTGMHHAIRPLTVQQISTYGYSSIGAMNFMSTMAQATAAGASIFLLKDKKMKQVATSATLSGFLGITEPALYAILVKYKAAMVGAFLGGGIGGLVGAVFNARAYASAMPSVLSIPVYLGETSGGFFLGFAATIISTFIITFILGKTVFLMKGGGSEEQAAKKPTNSSKTASATEIYSPVEGEIYPINEVSDETFSTEVLGKGIAVKPKRGRIVSPVDGIIKAAFHTKHAIGLETEEGMEVLIHIGINTVNLEGRYFELSCKEGEKVHRGDLLLTFDIKKIEEEGYDTTVMIIISNTNDYLSVIPEYNNGAIFEGEKIITTIK